MIRLVRLGVFSPSVLLEVAAESGGLRRAGLDVREIPVASSAQQFTMLLEGGLDAVLTSPDNVLAYRNPRSSPLGAGVDVRILAAVDRGLGLSLFSSPDAELRGGVLAVDAPYSGFAFAAYELLLRRGLRRGVDYEVAPLGSTPMRAEALMAGRCTMTMLNAGSDLRAEAAGCLRLSRAVTLGGYAGTVLAARGDDVDQGKQALRALTQVLLATAHDLVSGAAEAAAIPIAARRLGLDPAGAARYLATLADPQEGLVPDGRLDPAALETLRRLRTDHGSAAQPTTYAEQDPGLLDERFLPPPTPQPSSPSPPSSLP